MKTFKVAAKDGFEVREKIKSTGIIDSVNTCLMHNGGEVYLRTSNEDIIEALREGFELSEAEAPANFFDGDRGWVYFGNKSLFPTKLV